MVTIQTTPLPGAIRKRNNQFNENASQHKLKPSKKAVVGRACGTAAIIVLVFVIIVPGKSLLSLNMFIWCSCIGPHSWIEGRLIRSCGVGLEMCWWFNKMTNVAELQFYSIMGMLLLKLSIYWDL